MGYHGDGKVKLLSPSATFLVVNDKVLAMECPQGWDLYDGQAGV